VVTDEDSCPDGSDLLFYRPWYGTKLWCVCRYKNKRGEISFVKSYEGDCIEPNDKGYNGECLQLEALQPVMMGSIKDKRVCGYRDGDAFKDVTRPGPDGQCPEGTTPCS
jgi:hypothetical protein